MKNFKEILNSAGLTQKRFSEAMSIPLRTVEAWSTGDRTPPEYVERLILSEINKYSEKKKGVTYMKKITIYEYAESIINGDTFNSFFYTLQEAKQEASMQSYHLTKSEKMNRERYIIGHDLIFDEKTELPESAEDLVIALWNEDIVAEGYGDVAMNCDSFVDRYQSYFEEITE